MERHGWLLDVDRNSTQGIQGWKCAFIPSNFILQERFFPEELVLLVLDNCGPHKTPAVEQAFILAGWKVMFFPPNMTHLLQPMDLVVNSVVKSAMRKRRIGHLMKYFRTYQAECRQVQRLQPPLPLPAFNPPSPTIAHGLDGMFEMREQSLLKDSFKLSLSQGLSKCWIGAHCLKHRSCWYLCSLSRTPHPKFLAKEMGAGGR
jgi:hypothetical protein